MSQILLIRPGETVFDRDRRIQGNLNVPLSDAGRREVRRICREVVAMLQSRNGMAPDVPSLQVPAIQLLCVAPGDPSQETARLLTRGFADAAVEGLTGDGNAKKDDWVELAGVAGSVDLTRRARITGLARLANLANSAGLIKRTGLARTAGLARMADDAVDDRATDDAADRFPQSVAAEDGEIEVIPALRCRKVKTVNGFANLNQGLWQGMLIDDIRRSQPKIYRLYQESPGCVCPPEGESLPDARTRVLSALEKILRRYRDPNDVIGVVASAPIAGIIRQYLGGGELDDLWETFDEHGRWELLEAVPERMVA